MTGRLLYNKPLSACAKLPYSFTGGLLLIGLPIFLASVFL